MTYPTHAPWRPSAVARATGAIKALAILSVLVSALPAHAVPYFARKYETSCNTCHVAQPKLNDFGIAFRNNGYEWPGGEEEMTKQKPVVLSAEANKEAWPDAVWPSWFPSSVPLSLFMSEQLAISDKKYDRWVSPSGLGSGISLAAAGAIASGISMHALIGVSTNAGTGATNVSLPLAFVRFRLYKELLAIRLGKLTPDLWAFPSQSILGQYAVYSHRIGRTGWSPSGRQGLELQNISFKGRMRAVAGASGSVGQDGKNWDGWVHLMTKIGGIRLDGVEEGQEEASSPADAMHPWRDNSVQVGLSLYNGQASYLPKPTATTPITDVFTQYGLGVDWWYGDANLTVGYAIGHHSQLVPGKEGWVRTASAELDYVVYPWFIPSVLFEYNDDARFSAYSISNPKWHVVGGANFLVVSNVRAYATVEVGPYAAPAPGGLPTGDTQVDFLSGNLGVSLGF